MRGNEQLAEFLDYVISFYGKGSNLYDMGVTREHAAIATGMRIVLCRALGMDFDGDSFDREAVRDILIGEFGYEWVDG